MTTSAALRSFDRRFFTVTAIAFTLVVLAGFARTMGTAAWMQFALSLTSVV